MPASITWKTVITSSSILSLALVGDALIYAVLPVHAETFGIRLIRVGVLLSANRFVRVFAYGWIAVSAQRFGLRRICIAALLAAIVSTAMYGLATDAAALLFARILWGLAFASGFTIAGALLMLFFRSALGVLGPVVVVRRMPATQSAIGDLARMHAWRDVLVRPWVRSPPACCSR